jgi:hypothetical protein
MDMDMTWAEAQAFERETGLPVPTIRARVASMPVLHRGRGGRPTALA